LGDQLVHVWFAARKSRAPLDALDALVLVLAFPFYLLLPIGEWVAGNNSSLFLAWCFLTWFLSGLFWAFMSVGVNRVWRTWRARRANQGI
jgi:hypothetical protein